MLNIDTAVGTRSRPARTEDAPSTVRRISHSHGSDTKAAIDELIALTESRKSLRDWLIEKGAKTAVGEIVRVENSTIIRPQAARTWAPNHAADAAQRARAAKLDDIVSGALYNILLSANGRRVRFGDATKAEPGTPVGPVPVARRLQHVAALCGQLTLEPLPSGKAQKGA